MNTQEGKLIICPTPLGNLGDMTQRAIDALRSADCVCCEDTRVTGKLLAALGIEGVRLERLDEATLGRPANRLGGGLSPDDDYASVADATAQRVLEGERIVYCSDAGMPGVSDPGQRLVAAARDLGARVEVLPGPVAAVTAYVASGFICPRFYFGGFFPRKEGERMRTLEGLRDLDAVCIFYESPHRIVEALQAIARILPTRQVAVCRELTKVHEEVAIDTAEALAQTFGERAAAEGIKGEIVLIIDAPDEDEQASAREDTQERAAAEAQRLLAEGALSKKDIVAYLQSEFGIARNTAYGLVHGA